MTQHSDKVTRAFERYDHFTHYEQKNVFTFHISEVFQRYELTTSKKGNETRTVKEQWSEDLGSEVVEVVGFFRGTMIDNLNDGIRKNLALGDMYYETWTDIEPGVQKTTKIDCVRTVPQSLKMPSVMTDAELDATWLNPEWNPQ